MGEEAGGGVQDRGLACAHRAVQGCFVFVDRVRRGGRGGPSIQVLSSAQADQPHGPLRPPKAKRGD